MSVRILLVDDHAPTRELLREELELLGYEPVVAENGAEGVHRAESYRPDLIMMDIRMPVMDGFEAISRIRRNPRTSGIPVLAVTAKASRQDRDRCFERGCDGYIAKPFTHDRLDRAVRDLLRKAEHHRVLKQALASIDNDQV